MLCTLLQHLKAVKILTPSFKTSINTTEIPLVLGGEVAKYSHIEK